LAWSLDHLSDIRLQNSDTANRLKTLTQTKNAPASRRLPASAWNSSQNSSRLAMKKPYTTGTTAERLNRVASQPNSGTTATITKNTTVNMTPRPSRPSLTPISSRIGRTM
jgi:hypothetical protein